jgi:hypothetical protein
MDAGEEGPLALETILCYNCSVHMVPAHQRARLGKKEEAAQLGPGAAAVLEERARGRRPTPA